MRKKQCLAMLLAGGQGSRLGALTKKIAKPAVSFGGKYRIIDFSLSNCANSHIDTVGVLTQYKPMVLNAYIGTGAAWDMNTSYGGVHSLSPYATEEGGQWYEGTADAIFQNLDFIEEYDPEAVLIISGDHLYKMDYNKMLKEHKKNNADLTVSVITVPWDEANRFGILSVDEQNRIVKFSEKPKNPDSNLASMGVYIFNWKILRKVLIEDSQDETSDHDFGKNVIPRLLSQNKKLFVYNFEGYWRDVGTFDSYYDANMELLDEIPSFDIFSDSMQIFSNVESCPPQYLGAESKIENSLVCDGCTVLGHVKHSIISTKASVANGAEVIDSIILPGARIEVGATVIRSIVGEYAIIEAGATLGVEDKVTVVGNHRRIKKEV